MSSNCSSCGHENRDGARFCGGCGMPLAHDAGCPACGAPNPSGQRFCDACGAPLPGPGDGVQGRSYTPKHLADPSIRSLSGATPLDTVGGQPTRDRQDERVSGPLAYTPRHLVERILASRSALEGERKQVTVLFADVKGSMELAERVDAEEWHGILDRFFAILTDGVHRFGGTVNQYTGDGIMALFGAPLAHEDHAQRACYAALHLRAELRRFGDELRVTRGIDFSVRIGLNSGEVVVGKIGDDLRMDYTAQGHAVGLAARMQQIAGADRVYVGERTAELVAGLFRFRDLGPSSVKGIAAPVRVYELEDLGELSTRFDVSRQRGLSRFVGRSEEMAVLDVARAEARAGSGRVVGVVAEAGTGKSRLCYEFAERCRRDGMPVYEAHGLPHGRGIPLLPVLQLLRGLFSVTEQDDPEMARAKISGALLQLDDEFRAELPLLFEFLGVAGAGSTLPPADAGTRQKRLAGVAVRFVRARSQRSPLLVLVEDLHWIDAGSITFISALADAMPTTSAILLVNFRPEYAPPWRDRPFCGEVRLAPLGRAASEELLGALLGTDPSIAGVAERIAERAAGNPFFIEEIVRSLADAGRLTGERGAYRLAGSADEIVIPPTVRALLAARIDRLAAEEKDLLQTAAVLGKRFSEPLLRLVVGSARPEPRRGSHGRELPGLLRSLCDAGFLVEEALYPTPEYGFAHPLTQEVAYGSQLGNRRRSVHAAVAEALALLHRERLEEKAALIAYHFEAADLPWQAAEWNRRAAGWAAGTSAAQSLAELRKVLSLLGRVPPSRESKALALDTHVAILRLGTVVGFSPAETAEIFAAGRRLAEETGDRRALAELISTYGYHRMMAGQVADAHAHSEAAALLAGQLGDSNLELGLRLDMAQNLLWAGHLREALEKTDEVLGRLRQGGSMERGVLVGLGGEAFVMALRGVCLGFAGRMREAVGELEGTLSRARAEGGREGLCVAHNFRAMLAHVAEDVPAALAHSRAAADIAADSGTVFLTIMSRLNLGVALVLDGSWEEGRATLVEVLEANRASMQTTLFEAFGLVGLAGAELAGGDAERAVSTAARAVAVATEHHERLIEGIARIQLARALLAAGGEARAAEVRAELAATEELVRHTGAAAFWPRLHLERARLALASDDTAGSESALREATRLAEEMDMPGLARSDLKA